MTPKTLEYYDWDEIEPFICGSLGIESGQFRDYHFVIGGEYKDLWHVWITINQEIINNDAYVTMYLDDIDDLMETIIDRYGEWVECLRPVLIKLRDEIGEYPMIYYSW